MVAFNDDLPIQWHIIRQHRLWGTEPVSMKTAKSQCAFFTFNSRRPSIDFGVKVLAL